MKENEQEAQAIETHAVPATEAPAEPATGGEDGGSIAEQIEGEEAVVPPTETQPLTALDICDNYNIPCDSEEDALAAIDNYIKTERAINKKLVDTLRSEPKFGAFVGDIVEGATFEQAVMKNCDVAALAEKAEEMPDKEGLRAARDARLKRYQEIQEQYAADEEERVNFQKELDENGAVFKQTFEKFCAERGLDETEKDQLIRSIGELLSNVHKLKIGEDVIQTVWDSLRMDEIRNEAREQGVVEGRNQRIDTMRARRADNDGLPSLAGTSNAEREEPAEGEDPFFGSLLKKHKIK